MNKLKRPAIIVVCGVPLAGKSAVAKPLAEKLGIHLVDIDDNVRTPLIGLPHPHPDKSEMLMKTDKLEMAAAYDLVFATIETYVQRLRRSLIVTATFSSKERGQDRLVRTWKPYSDEFNLRVVWCNPQNFGDVEVSRRLEKRSFGSGYTGGVNSLVRVREVQERFQPIEIPGHLELDTSPPNTVDGCVAQALDYILA